MFLNTCPECRGRMQDNVEGDGLVCMRCGGLFLYHQGGVEFDHDEAYTAADRKNERRDAFRAWFHTYPGDIQPSEPVMAKVSRG